MSNKSKFASLDVKSLIEEGVQNAKGSEDAINYVHEGDFLKIGEIAAIREARIQKLFSSEVEPIHKIDIGIEQGTYSKVQKQIVENVSEINSFMKPSFSIEEPLKKIYFLPIEKKIALVEVEPWVEDQGLRLCTYGPNYLLGAMTTTFSPRKFPKELVDKRFIALETEPSFVFTLAGKWYYFLGVNCNDGRRNLELVDNRHDLSKGDVLLTELL